MIKKITETKKISRTTDLVKKKLMQIQKLQRLKIKTQI